MLPRSISQHDSRRSRRDPTAPLRHLDPVLLACTLALGLIGSLSVYSATRGPGPDFADSYLLRQFAFVVIGTGVMTVLALVDYHKLHDWAWLFYGATTVMLFLVLTPLGTGAEAKGAQAWFNLGPFQLQPAEFAKLSLIGALAFLLAEFKGDIDLRRLVALLLTAGVPMALIMLQPDIGLVLVLTVITLALLVVGGVPAKYLVVLVVVASVGVVGVLNSPVLKEYQRNRLAAFITPENTSDPATYNIDQSQQAIATGGVTGQGLFQGPQTRLGFVPEQETDFIFTAVAEQFGFVGSAMVLGLYGVLCYRIWRIASIARDSFGSFLCIGVLAMFAFSVFENVGMAMGIMPVTGIPLLLLSSGGSSTITCVRRHRAGPERSHAPVPVAAPRPGSIHPDERHVAPAGTPAGKVAKPLATSASKTVRSGRPSPRTSGLAPGVPGHLRDRPAQPGPADPVRDPQRTARCGGGAHLRPWGDLEELLRARRPAVVLARHPPSGHRLRRAGLQPVGRADLHEPAQHGRPGRGARAVPPIAAPSTCSWLPAALHLQPRAHRRLPRLRGAGRR